MDETLCTMCRTHEAVEDGFCSFQCENLFYDQMRGVEPSAAEAYDGQYDDSYEDHLAMYDNDPSPYDGTYSEE